MNVSSCEDVQNKYGDALFRLVRLKAAGAVSGPKHCSIVGLRVGCEWTDRTEQRRDS